MLTTDKEFPDVIAKGFHKMKPYQIVATSRAIVDATLEAAAFELVRQGQSESGLALFRLVSDNQKRLAAIADMCDTDR